MLEGQRAGKVRGGWVDLEELCQAGAAVCCEKLVEEPHSVWHVWGLEPHHPVTCGLETSAIDMNGQINMWCTCLARCTTERINHLSTCRDIQSSIHPCGAPLACRAPPLRMPRMHPSV